MLTALIDFIAATCIYTWLIHVYFDETAGWMKHLLYHYKYMDYQHAANFEFVATLNIESTSLVHTEAWTATRSDNQRSITASTIVCA